MHLPPHTCHRATQVRGGSKQPSHNLPPRTCHRATQARGGSKLDAADLGSLHDALSACELRAAYLRDAR